MEAAVALTIDYRRTRVKSDGFEISDRVVLPQKQVMRNNFREF